MFFPPMFFPQIFPRSRHPRRLALRLLVPGLVLAAAGAALADTRIFLLDTEDGYGVDGCLASGAPCGARIAAAWCRAHDYAQALDFGRAVAAEAARPLGSTSAPTFACTGEDCPTVVAITCTR